MHFSLDVTLSSHRNCLSGGHGRESHLTLLALAFISPLKDLDLVTTLIALLSHETDDGGNNTSCQETGAHAPDRSVIHFIILT